MQECNSCKPDHTEKEKKKLYIWDVFLMFIVSSSGMYNDRSEETALVIFQSTVLPPPFFHSVPAMLTWSMLAKRPVELVCLGFIPGFKQAAEEETFSSFAFPASYICSCCFGLLNGEATEWNNARGFWVDSSVLRWDTSSPNVAKHHLGDVDT